MMGLLADLILVLSASPGKACLESDVMMARVRAGGLLELLSVGAWAHALGYAPYELSGKSLRELTQLGNAAECRLVTALLDIKANAAPLEVTLLCKDARRKYFRFHRRIDPYQDAIYVVADEVPEGRFSPLSAYS